jgi:hypothetical protein
VQLEESLLSDSREEFSLISEMTVWGGDTDADPARRLAQREALGSFLGHQDQRRIGECPLEIPVVVDIALLLSGSSRRSVLT